jgi:type III secretion protein W
MGSISGEGLSAAELAAAEITAEKTLEVAVAEVAEQAETSEDTFAALEDLSNPLAGKMKADAEELKKRPIEKPTKAEQKAAAERVLIRDDSEKSAFHFAEENKEFKGEILVALLKRAVECKDKDELITLINQFYPDPTLADQALDYLLQVALGPFKEIVIAAKAAHNERFSREILAGQNIKESVRQYSAMGLGEPIQLRNLYRELTANPREATTLYKELLERYKTQNIRTVIAYLCHAIGSDLDSRSSIEPGLLHNLLLEVRSLQAGLGLQRFFITRMKLVSFLFERSGLTVPPELTYESMSLQFISLLEDRYPSADKALKLPDNVGLESASTLAKIIVLSQDRDAVREVAVNLFYRSQKHRDDVLTSILDALESLEQKYDEELEGESGIEDAPKAIQPPQHDEPKSASVVGH